MNSDALPVAVVSLVGGLLILLTGLFFFFGWFHLWERDRGGNRVYTPQDKVYRVGRLVFRILGVPISLAGLALAAFGVVLLVLDATGNLNQ